MIKFNEKIIVFFLGISVAILLIEIILRIIGYIHIKTVTSDRIIKKNDYVILCIGDSFTLGAGAPPDKSYPRQLEDLLNKEIKEVRFRVINRGMGGCNTSMILTKMAAYINETNPDLVVLLAGSSNGWNAWGYRHHLKKRVLFYKIQDFLYSIKVYKLIKLFCSNIRDKINNILQGISKSEIFAKEIKSNNQITLREHKRSLSEDASYRCSSPEVWENRNMICTLEIQGKYNEAIESCRKIIEKCPNDSSAHFEIGRMYIKLDNKREAEEWIKKAIELNPKDFNYLWHLALLSSGQDPKETKRAIQFLYKFIKVEPRVIDLIDMLSNRDKYTIELRQWVKSDILEMIHLCNSKGVKIILHNFPWYNDNKETKNINLAIEEVARGYSLLFVDNYQIFQELWARGEKKEDYYALDNCHCNAKGYNRIAKNIYDKIIEEKLITADNLVK